MTLDNLVNYILKFIEYNGIKFDIRYKLVSKMYKNVFVT